MSYIVYKHTAPNGKVYIGITNQKPEYRWKNGNGYTRQPHFYNAIQKYGWESFSHEIISDGLTMEQACQMEKDLIANYRSNDPAYGYNITEGGEGRVGVPLSDEHKRKIGDARRGTHQSEETCIKISEALKGKPKSEEHKLKLSEGRRGHTPKPESIEKFKATRKERSWGEVRTTSHMITYNGKTQTLTQWAKELNVPRNALSMRICKYGWSVERAFTQPIKNRNALYTYNGKTLTLKEWADEIGVNYNTLIERMCRLGLTFEEAIEYRGRKI